MVERIIELVGLHSTSENIKINEPPACSNNILDNDLYGKTRVKKWSGRAVVGCMRYYISMVRPDITMATQHRARFCNSNSRAHKESANRICR